MPSVEQEIEEFRERIEKDSVDYSEITNSQIYDLRIELAEMGIEITPQGLKGVVDLCAEIQENEEGEEWKN